MDTHKVQLGSSRTTGLEATDQSLRAPGRRETGPLDRLTSYVADNGYAPGDRLPPERALCVELGLSRRALRKALDTLEREGRVRRGVGQGTFLARGLGAVDIGTDAETFARFTNPSEILETRLVIEPALAAFAAARATVDDLERIERLLPAGRAAGDPAGWEAVDRAFHRAIAEASHNGLLIALFEMVDRARSLASWGRMRERALTALRRDVYRAQHDRIFEAIADRVPSAAREAMAEHLKTGREVLLEGTVP